MHSLVLDNADAPKTNYYTLQPVCQPLYHGNHTNTSVTESYDVIVVGGGPAGSSAAMQAARDGANVLLVEREPEIAATVRTSGVTWMETIREYGIPRSCYNPIKNYGFCSPDNQVLVKGDRYGAAVLDVRGAYRWLARQAQEAGARILTGINVNGARRNKNGIEITGSGHQGKIQAQGSIIIDASGFPGAVIKYLKLAPPWSRFGAGAEYELEAENVEHDTWWLMVGSMYSPAGYAWIFPISPSRVRVGVGVAKPQRSEDPRRILDDLLANGTGPVGSLGKTRILEYHYGLIPNSGIDRSSVYERVILAGDTAGQANPLVLEGIRYAIRFGRMAGSTAAKAALQDDASLDMLRHYEKAWRSEAESRIKSAYKVQKRWLDLTDPQWDRELDIINELNADQFLAFVRADFGLYNMTKLAVRHPKLAVRQLFGLLR